MPYYRKKGTTTILTETGEPLTTTEDIQRALKTVNYDLGKFPIYGGKQEGTQTLGIKPKTEKKEPLIIDSEQAQNKINKFQKETGATIGEKPSPITLWDKKGNKVEVSPNEVEEAKKRGYVYLQQPETKKEEPTEETALTSEELAVLGLTPESIEAVDQSTAQALKKGAGSLLDLEEDIKSVKNKISQISTSEEDATSALIDALKRNYDYRISQARDASKRYIASLKALGYRTGAIRYGGEVFGGVISTAEMKAQQEVANLEAERDMLIAKAKQALYDKQYDKFAEELGKLEENRQKKIEALMKLYQESFKKNQELEQKKEEITKENNIIAAIQQYDTKDPAELFKKLNYDETTGEWVGGYTLDDIEKVLEKLPKEKEEEFKVLDGVPYRVIRDKDGKVTGFEKIPGVEKEEDVKWANGIPYRAVRDAKGNIIRYEKIPGVEKKEEEKTVKWSEWAAKRGLVGLPYEEAQDLLTRETPPKWFKQRTRDALMKAIAEQEKRSREPTEEEYQTAWDEARKPILQTKEPKSKGINALIWEWLGTYGDQFSDEEKKKQIMRMGANPQDFGIY